MVAVAKMERGEGELDSRILSRAQAGDEGAFRILVQRYQLPVYHLLWRMLEAHSGQARVEEITQDVFIKIYRALATFKNEGSAKLSTWIFMIATRTAINELRRPHVVLPLKNQEEVVDSSSLSPEKELIRRRNAKAIRCAISDLSPENRAALILREYHDLDYAEIAAMLKIGIGTVKSRLSRARQKLKAALREVCDE